jgi:hypothetical protein
MKYLLLVLLAGCSTFTTTQTDKRTNEKTGETTTVITHARSTTFFDSKSNLAKWKATQSEKSQGAEVGGLAQESNGTNVTQLIEAVTRAVVQGAMKGIVP